jgi:hypothetical protein
VAARAVAVVVAVAEAKAEEAARVGEVASLLPTKVDSAAIFPTPELARPRSSFAGRRGSGRAWPATR